MIYKYADAAKGSTVQTAWGTLEASAIAIAVDGNLYALHPDGRVGKYFKGKKEGEAIWGVLPAADSRLIIGKDWTLLYLADPAARRVYVFDKLTGQLQTTYKLDAAGDIRDVRVANDGIIWILGTDNKTWQIKP